MVIDTSTFSGNESGGGGGAINHSTPMTLIDCTVSDNESTGDFGGGIYTFGEGALALRNTTVVNNRAAIFGGGVLIGAGAPFTVSNSVLAGNTASSGRPDCSATAISDGFNLIGDGAGCSGFTGTGDQVGTSGSPLDPLLGLLADNGDPTDTHLPLAGSPLIDNGNPAPPGPVAPACQITDQRGAPRPSPLRRRWRRGGCL